MGESRQELLAWLNDLLQINYTKVEQCGTGAAYCQIIDSIFGDVAMSKVKMGAKQEYEYILNYKVLQNSFKTHSIDKPIDVEKLSKCKNLDNLEFLQWLKKFWDLNFPGGSYDPIARRQGKGVEPGGAIGSMARGGPGAVAKTRSATSAPPARTSSAASGSSAPRRPPTTSTVRSSTAGTRTIGSAPNRELTMLTEQMNEMKLNVEGLEKERDFYFNKLREVEVLVGARLELEDETMTDAEKEQLLAIQAVLYSTEEGFEAPEDEAEAEFDAEGGEPVAAHLEDEEETF